MTLSVRKYSFLFLYLSALAALTFFIERQDFNFLISAVTISFVCYYALLKQEISIKEIFIFGLILRGVLFFSLPTLSDDYFRFIWDGKMVLSGISPFEYLPSEFAQSTKVEYLIYLAQEMNSPDYFSVYPPISQFIYSLSAIIESDFISVSIIRLFLFVGDILAFVFMRKLLFHFNKNENLSAIYFLNPLVIIELTGNLHFEGLMLAFLLMSIFFLLKHRYSISAILFSISVGVKLLPLMFVPLLFFKLPIKWKFKYSIIVIGLLFLQFLPFVNIELLEKMLSSVNLYFQSFEFNASLYYVFRWIGYQIYGYNIIQTLGVSLAILSLLSILILSFIKREEKIFLKLLLLNTIYLLLSTTIHPWYLILPLAFSIFTNYKFVVVWSLLIFLSYSAYQTEIYQENLFLVGVEYVLVFGFLIFEIYRTIKIKNSLNH